MPMVVLTADRPEELRGVGAPQTIDQLQLYGAHTRWFRDADVAAWSDRGTWRRLAGDAWAHLTLLTVTPAAGKRRCRQSEFQPG